MVNCIGSSSGHRTMNRTVKFTFYLFTFLFFALFNVKSVSGANDLDSFYLENIVDKYSVNNILNLNQLQQFLDDISKNGKVKSKSHSVWMVDSSTGNSTVAEDCWESIDVRNVDYNDNSTQQCLLKKCLNASHILELYNLPPTGAGISATFLLQTLSPVLLYQAQSQNCNMNASVVPEPSHVKPSVAEVWGYGFLFVSIINLSSLVGVWVVPLMKKRIYHVVLMFLVALAVGVLSGSALLFLIPDALGLAEIPELKDVYHWKALTVIGGIYLFFLVERVLAMIMHAKEKYSARREDKYSVESASEKDVQVIPYIKDYGDTTTNTEDHLLVETRPQAGKNGTVVNGDVKPAGEQEHGHSHGKVAPVAWMIIFGDGLHNFIDGLAIGAAFTESTLAGISISLAVICEEFPHELGDFAVLLKSGMSVKRAVLFNFLSACLCYLGLIIGIVIGELSMASRWIFALAGGMFLYISLVDMMPEMNTGLAESGLGKKMAFLIQNLGMLAGFGIMFLLAVYGGEIDFTS